jgi:hypothetical protein
MAAEPDDTIAGTCPKFPARRRGGTPQRDEPSAAADPGAVPPAVARVHDLARLSPAEAERLQGRRALFRVTPGSLPDAHDGFTLYDAVSPPWADAGV